MSGYKDQVDLHTLNNLLAQIEGTDISTLHEIRSAINFTMEHACPGGPDEDDFLDKAESLLKLHQFQKTDPFMLEHCDFRKESYDPLWIRAHLNLSLHRLAGYANALLLITGIRRMICPPGCKWTSKREQQYNNAVSYIEEVCRDNVSSKTRLLMLFL